MDEKEDLKKKDENFWKTKLTPEEFAILREKGTETPFTGEYLHNDKKGMYKCLACGNPLFSSKTKFESGSGWPSFYDVISKGNVEIKPDYRYGMVRDEVVCAKCGGHLGHFFDLDSTEIKHSGYYCINSKCLSFEEENV